MCLLLASASALATTCSPHPFPSSPKFSESNSKHSKSFSSRRMKLWITQQADITTGISCSSFMSRYFRRRNFHLSRPIALSTSTRVEECALLDFFCTWSKCPLSRYGTNTCFFSGYAESPKT